MKYLLVLISVSLGAFAQFLFKIGVNSVIVNSHINLKTLVDVFLNVNIIRGLSLYILSVIIWFIVLSQFELSKAYPFVSIGYIITMFLGYFLLGEPLSVYKVIGIALIGFGVIVLSLA